METIIVTPGWHKLIFHLYFAYSWFEMIRYCHPRIALAFALLAATTAGARMTSPADFDAQTARGTIVSHLACFDDPIQSYAVCLPSRYSPDRTWPILKIDIHFANRNRTSAMPKAKVNP